MLCLAFPALPLSADTLSEPDTIAIETTVAEFNTAFAEGDMATVMAAMPPGMKNFIAENAGMTTEELDATMISQTQAAMADITLESFDMDIETATNDVTSDNRPYSMIPTTTVMSSDALGRVRNRSTTLALKEDGAWYLVRIDNANQIGLLTAVYPDFNGVEFPSGSMESIE